MDIVEFHRRALEGFGRHVRTTGDDQWHLPTPCSEWDVHALVNHLVNESYWTAPLLQGKTIAEVGDVFDGDLLGDDPKGAWDKSAAEAVAAAAAPGATTATAHVSFGDIPGADYLQQLFHDYLIHGWDLARAIGADETLDPVLVEVCYSQAKPVEDLLKASGVFGDKLEPPEGADLQTKLLAVFGRRAWEPWRP